MRSRKGSYLVEAVLIMPLIVVITIIMMCASMHTYMNTVCAAKMDREVRKQTGESSQTVFFVREDENLSDGYDSFADKYEIERSIRTGTEKVTASRNSDFTAGVNWIKGRKNCITVRSSEISECQEIWMEMY